MKKAIGLSFAIILLLTACGVTTTPVTETAAPTPVVETSEPEPAGFDVLTPAEGTDYIWVWMNCLKKTNWW